MTFTCFKIQNMCKTDKLIVLVNITGDKSPIKYPFPVKGWAWYPTTWPEDQLNNWLYCFDNMVMVSRITFNIDLQFNLLCASKTLQCMFATVYGRYLQTPPHSTFIADVVSFWEILNIGIKNMLITCNVT